MCLLLPFSTAYLHSKALAQVMACGIYGSHHNLCGVLLRTIVFSPDVRYIRMVDFPVLFTLAILKGNKQLVELILKHGTKDQLEVFSECVKLLFDVFSSGGTKHNAIYTIDDTYEAILEQLLRTGCNVDPEFLLYRAASHVSPAALRCVFKVYPHVSVDKMQEHVASTPLRETLEYGGVECTSLLLEHDASIPITETIPSKATVLHMAV